MKIKTIQIKTFRAKLLLIAVAFTFFDFNTIVEPKPEFKTPEDALAELMNGNLRFRENKMTERNYRKEIEATMHDQNPHTFILGCIDSRVTPEIIFDQGLGEIFVSRVAGNVENEDILGSMEFALKMKHTKLIVILGHSHCGAVKGAIDKVELEHLTQLVDQISYSVDNSHQTYPLEDVLVENTAKKHIDLTIKHILNKSKTILHMFRQKEISIVGAYYDITTGKVEFLKRSW